MTGASRARTTDDGIGLVEVVVAMLLFALLALALLPLALQATTLSADNRDRASANTFASGRLASVRAAFPDTAATTCAAVRGSGATGVADPAGSRLVADVVVASCPTTYPSALTVRVDIRNLAASSPSTIITTISTKVVVTGP